MVSGCFFLLKTAFKPGFTDADLDDGAAGFAIAGVGEAGPGWAEGFGFIKLSIHLSKPLPHPSSVMLVCWFSQPGLSAGQTIRT